MRHAEHHFLHAFFTGHLNDVVEQRNQTLAALQRESFLPDEARVQIFFQRFGCRQTLEQKLFFFGVERRLRLDAFELPLHPALLLGGADVHILDTNEAAIGFLHRRHNVFQLRLVVAAVDATLPGTDAKLRLKIGVGQIVVTQFQLRHRHALAAL